MNPSDTNPQIDWQLISQAIASGVIPAPAGSNENGEPFWEINSQQVTWQQVQEFVLKAKQAASNSAGGGIESMPQMPIMPNFESIDVNFENRVERSSESRSEDSNIESPRLDSTTQTTAPVVEEDDKPKGPSLIGKSPKLNSVDTSDPKSMLEFVKNNKTKSDSSNRFLAEFLEKILQVLSIDVD